MTEGPVRIGSFLNYQIVLFLLVIVWAFIGFEVAQFQLLPLYEAPYNWIAWAIFVLVSIIPAITAVTWRMKTQIIYIDPEWEFREREISLSEYTEMMKQYRTEYRNYLSVVDYNLILLCCFIALAAVVSPFLLMRTTLIVIAATPVIFGIFVLLFGLVYSSIMFKFIPNEATPHFPDVSEKVLRPIIEKMNTTPGVSWAGVGMMLGQASGYYTIRDARPVSRIEGIESVAKIQGTMDEFGQVSKIVSTISLNDSNIPRVIDEYSGVISHKQLTELVLKTIKAYTEAKGADEVLEEVVEEVIHFLKQFNDTDNPKSS